MATVEKLESKELGTYYEVKNENGVVLGLHPFGARSISLVVPVDDTLRDVLVGCKTIADYKENSYYNAAIGPVAGRIAGARFELEGTIYETEANQKGNTLHGGFEGFDLRDWQAQTFSLGNKAGVVFTLEDEDGNHGFPGNVVAKVTYTLSDDNQYSFKFEATTDKATLFNPTNHGYYNLTGTPSEAIDEHLLQINAKFVAKTNNDVTTTGEKVAVAGTKFDFISENKIGETLLDDPFLIEDDAEEALTLTSPDGKVALTLITQAPAVVIYTTGTAEAGTEMKNGVMANHGAVAIEPQGVPGTEIYPQFGSITLTPDEPYSMESTFKLVF
ncbi:aldose 1-epimerase [Enterococcus saigonensis]|uniref:Aldose 1-epimerase n=1 Tax=Enterococcus saigonensis TaxID=1805431 RepID=A0A679IRZ1_9ENTE|nr:aldose epimerase family protein [Enterococcus saigonensis]BCA86157.1 aldose 1-epimerase [Enterococcus saigonensis]